jgi:hypothetical protein
MTDLKKESSDHIDLLLCVVRNTASFSSLEAVLAEEPNPSYWIYVLNNFYDLTILEWCKVFGSYGEPTHWTTLVPEPNRDSFRKGLLNHVGLTESGWQFYCEQVRDYRNHRLAHHQRSTKITHYPALDNILKSAFYYHDWLVKQLEVIAAILAERYPTVVRAFKPQGQTLARLETLRSIRSV